MYIKRLIIVLIITVLAATGIGMAFDNIYKKRWATLFFEKTDILLKETKSYDIIFLGNSRMHFGINPYYIDSITKRNSYNFGNGGADAEDMLLTARLYLQKHPAPEIVIISPDMGALTKSGIMASRFHYLYYLQNDTVSRYMNDAGFQTSLLSVLPFMKYSFFDEYNRTSLFVKGRQYPSFRHNIYKGFLNIHPQVNKRVTNLYNFTSMDLQLWDTAISYFRNTVSAFQRAGSTVIFVYPPERAGSALRSLAFKKQADSIFIHIANDFHIRQISFENDPAYTDEYFVDDIHLNEPGTKIFSIQLADSLRSGYLK